MKADVTKKPSDYSGQYPEFFEAPGVDKLFSVCITLAQELSVAKDSISDLQQLLVGKGVLTADELTTFTPSKSSMEQRNTEHQQYIQRLLKVFEVELNGLESEQE